MLNKQRGVKIMLLVGAFLSGVLVWFAPLWGVVCIVFGASSFLCIEKFFKKVSLFGCGSMDLTVGEIYSFATDELPPRKLDISRGFILRPGEGILVESREIFSFPVLPSMIGWVVNRSYHARKGLAISRESFGPDYYGPATYVLENINKFPVIIKRGSEIGQMIFSVGDSPFSWYKTGEKSQLENSAFKSTTFTLGNEFVVFEGSKPDEETHIKVPEGESFTIYPGQFVLGITQEEAYLEGEGFVGYLTSANTYLSKGVQLLEGVLQPGYKGKITLEFVNRGPRPVELVPGVDIYKVYYWRAKTKGSYDKDSRSMYVGDKTKSPHL